MPAKSEAQRRALNAKFGHAWVKEHHFDNKGPLPERIHPKKKRKKKGRSAHEKLARHVLKRSVELGHLHSTD